MEKIKVIVTDDIPIWRNTLTRDLNTENIEVIGSASNGLELLDLIRVNMPDIVTLDLNMPVMGGFDVLKILTKDFPGIKALILSDHCTDYFVSNAILIGGRGYLQKTSHLAEIKQALRDLHADGFFFNKIVSREILSELRSTKRIRYLMNNHKFSQRDIEVLKLLCDGLTFDQIAEKLNISSETVRYYRRNLTIKTDEETLIDLVKYAVRQGIVKIE